MKSISDSIIWCLTTMLTGFFWGAGFIIVAYVMKEVFKIGING